MRCKNLIGERFGRLLVVKRVDNDKYGRPRWLVHCDCKKEFETLGNSLKSGFTKSCGCYKKERVTANNKARALPFGEGCFNFLFKNYKNEARRRGHVFELTKEQFRVLTKGLCFYCGCEPTREFKRKLGYNGSYIYNGIDRLDSKLGYTKDNCVTACGVHNLMKLDMSVDDFLRACREVTEFQKINCTC